jgi:hypothetical protein
LVRGKADEAPRSSAGSPAALSRQAGIIRSSQSIFKKSDFAEMLTAAECSSSDGRGVSQMLIAIAAAELDDSGRARQALEKMAAHDDFA